jgi:thioredoxin 1
MAELILTATNFDEEIKEGITLVDFWAPWCGPCQAMMPVVDEIAKEMEGKIKVGKINIDEESELAQKFGVMSIPTFKIFKNGEEVGSITGGVAKEELVVEIEKIVSS